MDAAGMVALVGGVVALITVLGGGIAGVVTMVDRRKADASTVWRDVAEARGAAEHDCLQRCAALEARVDMLEDEWRERLTRDVAAAAATATATAVTEVVVAAIREERRHGR